jgi:hypothetical protein
MIKRSSGFPAEGCGFDLLWTKLFQGKAGRNHYAPRNRMANTTKIEDKAERKTLKRAARKKAAPKAKRTTPRGSSKKKTRKVTKGQSKR